MGFRRSPLLIALVLAGCADVSRIPTDAAAGQEAYFAKAGGSGGDALVADAIAGDFASATSSLLVSSCAGDVWKSYGVDYGPGSVVCLTVVPTGSDYGLTDDILVLPKSSRGAFTSVRVWGQDVVGPDGVMHDTDPITVAVPTAGSPTGFTLHVHADNVPVYRLSGHTGGPRVRMIGTIAIGDIVYRLP